MRAIFAQNMTVARFLHDMADIGEADEDNKLFFESEIYVSNKIEFECVENNTGSFLQEMKKLVCFLISTSRSTTGMS